MGFVQSNIGTTGTIGTLLVSFTSDVTAGNTIAACIIVSVGTSGLPPFVTSVTDSQGNAYSFLSTGSAFATHMYVYEAYAGTTGPCTVTLTFTDNDGGAALFSAHLNVREYNSLPAIGTTASSGNNTGFTCPVPNVTVAVPGFLLVIGFNQTFPCVLSFSPPDYGNLETIDGADGDTSIFGDYFAPSAGTYGGETMNSTVGGISHCSVLLTTLPPAPTPLSITCASPPSGEVGVAYSHAFPATGGTPVYTFSIVSGSLPTELSLDASTGVVSGTPSASGTFPFTIQVEDSVSATASVACSITIGTATSITCASPPQGEVGVAYTHTFPASGGTSPYTFTIISGSLPPGTTLNGSTGVVSGTPTVGGTYPFTIQATDSVGSSGNVACSITIITGPGISCGSPPTGSVGVAYSHAFPASGGSTPYTFSIITGSLPTGLTLDASTGIASGTPTAVGTFPFTVQVTDAASMTNSVPCSIAIISTLAIMCGSPPSGVVGVAYSHTFPAAGGTPAYTFAIISGSLPTGVTLNTSTGTAAGTPTIAGTYPFTIQVTDSFSVTASVPCSIVIAAPGLSISCASPPAGTVGQGYSHAFPATGGTTPYIFSIISGALPPGVVLNSSTGLVGGTPTMAGVFNFTIQVMDATSATASVACFITITQGLAANCNNPPLGTIEKPYSHTFSASFGAPTYVFSITAGALPDGITLASNGVASGIPTIPGSFSFTLTVTDSASAASSVNCQIAVVGPCPCEKLPDRTAWYVPPVAYQEPPTITGRPYPAPMQFFSDDGTVQGAIDGVNRAFRIAVPLHRAQVFRNGVLQTLNFDCSFSGTGLLFAKSSVPIKGDRVSIVGWVLG
jgi:hypothetical protein